MFQWLQERCPYHPQTFEDASGRPDDMYASRQLKELVDATVDLLSPSTAR